MKAPTQHARSALAVLAVFVSFNTFAAQSIEGFRGLKWGDAPSALNVPKLDEKSSTGELCYIQPNEKLAIGDATVSKVKYCFYKDRLSTVLITFPTEQDGESILRTLSEAYGKPRQQNRYLDTYHWLDQTSIGILQYRKSGGFFGASSQQISNERKADEKNRAKEAAADL